MPSAVSPRTNPAFPREHGFWAMLLGVLGTALLRAPFSLSVLLTALVTLWVFATLGGRYSRQIRKNPTAQLASSVLLALAGIPVALAGRVDYSEVLATTLVWMVLFFSFALLVRSAFARAGRASDNPWEARRLVAGSLVCSWSAALAFYWLGLPIHAGAAAIGAVGAAAVAAWRPTVKELKPAGIALASLIVCCGLFLSIWGGTP